MGRRRMYVFGTIIVAGILIGLFCLPDSSDRGADRVADTSSDGGKTRIDNGQLPAARIGETKPEAKARKLYEQAMTMTDAKQKGDTLVKAYRTKPDSRWGGEAAAELGHMWMSARKPAVAQQWYRLAANAPLTPETLRRVNAQLTAMKKRATAVVQPLKMLTYKIQRNDSLWKIGKRYAVTSDLLMRVNKLNRDLIREGATLKVPKGPFDVRITKSTHQLRLLQENKPVRVYTIGLGAADTPTEIGTFTVTSKLKDPVWYSDKGRIAPGDPRNVLGSRWIGFNGRIGIHGTRKSDEDTIGKNVSNGCIRMRDSDVKEVYDFVVRHKSKVTIVD